MKGSGTHSDLVDMMTESGDWHKLSASVQQQPKLEELVRQIEPILKFIKGGYTIPGFKSGHPDGRIAILQEVMHGAQVKAQEGLELLEKYKG